MILQKMTPAHIDVHHEKIECRKSTDILDDNIIFEEIEHGSRSIVYVNDKVSDCHGTENNNTTGKNTKATLAVIG